MRRTDHLDFAVSIQGKEKTWLIFASEKVKDFFLFQHVVRVADVACLPCYGVWTSVVFAAFKCGRFWRTLARSMWQFCPLMFATFSRSNLAVNFYFVRLQVFSSMNPSHCSHVVQLTTENFDNVLGKEICFILHLIKNSYLLYMLAAFNCKLLPTES